MIDPNQPLNGLSTLSEPQLAQSKNTREAAEQFESYLFTFMAQTMRPKSEDGLFSSQAMQTFSDLFDQEIGKRIGEGHALGLADQLEAALNAHGMATPPPMMPPVTPTRGYVPGDGKHPKMGVDGVFTSGFGPRNDPINGDPRMHKGVDLSAPMGTPIHVVRPGKVTFAGPSGGHGNFIMVDHGNGICTHYAHCSKIDVQVGDTVSENDVIGAVGSTGHSTGPHLHYEVYVNGQAVDPMKYRWADGR